MGIYIDLTKVLDSHKHQILLYELEQYRNTDNASNLIESHPLGRRQILIIGENFNGYSDVTRDYLISKYC